jgi:phosphoglycerate dehydrogenase-like enzyme
VTTTTAAAVTRQVAGPPRCAVLPTPAAPLVDGVADGGGILVDVAAAEAIMWADPRSPRHLADLLDTHPAVRWVQLPFAGIEPFRDVLDRPVTWTCGKGVYAEPVAEHALALVLAGLRHVAAYARTVGWSAPAGRNLLGARVTVLGGGEITRSLLRLLAPFGCEVTVVRRQPAPIEGATRVVGPDDLDAALRTADVVVLALALTPETEQILDARRLALLPNHAWVVNVARGGHVDTDALVAALSDGALGGATLDVTDPEPLPDDHPLWRLDTAIITPHVGNTPEMAVPLLRARVAENVRRYADGAPLLGPVDPRAGY